MVFVDHADAVTNMNDRAALASLLDDLVVGQWPGRSSGRAGSRCGHRPDPRTAYFCLTLSSAPPGGEPDSRGKMMMFLSRAPTSPASPWLTLVGLVLVPLLVAGGFLWATWNSDTRLDQVEAAVVNLDEPVKLNGQLVPLGGSWRAGWCAATWTTATSPGC